MANSSSSNPIQNLAPSPFQQSSPIISTPIKYVDIGGTSYPPISVPKPIIQGGTKYSNQPPVNRTNYTNIPIGSSGGVTGGSVGSSLGGGYTSSGGSQSGTAIVSGNPSKDIFNPIDYGGPIVYQGGNAYRYNVSPMNTNISGTDNQRSFLIPISNITNPNQSFKSVYTDYGLGNQTFTEQFPSLRSNFLSNQINQNYSIGSSLGRPALGHEFYKVGADNLGYSFDSSIKLPGQLQLAKDLGADIYRNDKEYSFNLPTQNLSSNYNQDFSPSSKSYSIPPINLGSVSGQALVSGSNDFKLPKLQGLGLSSGQLSGGSVSGLGFSNTNFNQVGYSLSNLQGIGSGTNNIFGGSTSGLGIGNASGLGLGDINLQINIPSRSSSISGFTLPKLQGLGLSSGQLSGGSTNGLGLGNTKSLGLSNINLQVSGTNGTSEFTLPNLQGLGLSPSKNNDLNIFVSELGYSKDLLGQGLSNTGNILKTDINQYVQGGNIGFQNFGNLFDSRTFKQRQSDEYNIANNNFGLSDTNKTLNINPLSYSNSTGFNINTISNSTGNFTTYSLNSSYFQSPEYKNKYNITNFSQPRTELNLFGSTNYARTVGKTIEQNYPKDTGNLFGDLLLNINPLTEVAKSSSFILSTGAELSEGLFIAGPEAAFLKTTEMFQSTLGGSPFFKYEVTPTYQLDIKTSSGTGSFNIPFKQTDEFQNFVGIGDYNIFKTKVGGVTPEYTISSGKSLLGGTVNVLKDNNYILKAGIDPGTEIKITSGDYTFSGKGYAIGGNKEGLGFAYGDTFAIGENGKITSASFNNVFKRSSLGYQSYGINFEGLQNDFGRPFNFNIPSVRGNAFLDLTNIEGNNKLSFTGLSTRGNELYPLFESTDIFPTRTGQNNFAFTDKNAQYYLKLNLPQDETGSPFKIIKGTGSKSPYNILEPQLGGSSSILTKSFEVAASKQIPSSTSFDMFPKSAFYGTGQYERSDGGYSLTKMTGLNNGGSLINTKDFNLMLSGSGFNIGGSSGRNKFAPLINTGDFERSINGASFLQPTSSSQKFNQLPGFKSFQVVVPIESNDYSQSLQLSQAFKLGLDQKQITSSLFKIPSGTGQGDFGFKLPDFTGFGGGFPDLSFGGSSGGSGRKRRKVARPQRVSPSLLGIADFDLLGIKGSKPLIDVGNLGLGINPFDTRYVYGGSPRKSRSKSKSKSSSRSKSSKKRK